MGHNIKDQLALGFNIPSKYRESIYKLIDQNWDCEWVFHQNDSDIKCFDIRSLKKTVIGEKNKIFGNFYWQTKIFCLLKNKKAKKFFLLGDPYNISIWFLCIILKLFRPKAKIYFWSHGWYGHESKIKRITKKAFFNFADKIFLYGNYAKNLMIKEGVNPDKLVVIHNSLDYDKQLELRNSCKESDIYIKHFGNDNPNLIFIGRLTKVKQIELVIQAIYNLKKENKNYNLTLVGSGEEEENLKNLVKSLGLEDQVWFFGACYDEKQNAELIYNADLCVSPGNVGLTAIHSMMFGTPVITHDDFPWQMPEFEAIQVCKTGAFFKKDDVNSLADAINTWFDGPGKNRHQIRQNCYIEIDNSWNPTFQIEILKDNLNVSGNE